MQCKCSKFDSTTQYIKSSPQLVRSSRGDSMVYTQVTQDLNNQ